MNELKPCPFCGGEARKRRMYSSALYYVECTKCLSETGYYISVERAGEAWNTRAHSECHLDSPCEYQNEDIRME